MAVVGCTGGEKMPLMLCVLFSSQRSRTSRRLSLREKRRLNTASFPTRRSAHGRLDSPSTSTTGTLSVLFNFYLYSF